MRLPSRWVTHQEVDGVGPVAAASGPAAGLAFAAAMEAPSAMDGPISNRARGLGRDTERYLKGFIRDMVGICRYSLGRKMSGMVYALFRRKKSLTFGPT